MNENIVVGVDIGGSHITAALIDLNAHAIIQESLVRTSVDAKAGVEGIIGQWTHAITASKAFHQQPSSKIGIAMPGPFDYDSGISYVKGLDKYEALYQQNVKQLLAAALQVDAHDIHMMNDASCFLKGEVFGGAATGGTTVIGITLGTGLGSAAYKDRVVYEGDLYAMPYQQGTAEDYVSARWLVQEYHRRTTQVVHNVKALCERVPYDDSARAVFREFGGNLGTVLARYNSQWNADTVVIGGNVANAWSLFIPETERVLQEHGMHLPLLRAKLGEEAALLGAGSLCM